MGIMGQKLPVSVGLFDRVLRHCLKLVTGKISYERRYRAIPRILYRFEKSETYRL